MIHAHRVRILDDGVCVFLSAEQRIVTAVDLIVLTLCKVGVVVLPHAGSKSGPTLDLNAVFVILEPVKAFLVLGILSDLARLHILVETDKTSFGTGDLFHSKAAGVDHSL